MLKEFRQFLLRGNVVDLAVAVVIGAAFGAVTTALVKDLLTPLIAAIAGEPDFSNLTFTIHGSVFRYGSFLNALISFFTIAAAVFFGVVKPVNVLMDRFRTEPPIQHETRRCPQCLSEIPTKAQRCAFCTSEVGAAA
jgi:large conductance mechanosensitive channel